MGLLMLIGADLVLAAGGFFWTYIAAKKDVKLFKYPATAAKVGTDISTDSPDDVLLRAFIRQNFHEMTFFWTGLFVGSVLGAWLGVF